MKVYKDNEFIYWREAKAALIDLINTDALDIMMVPAFSVKKPNGEMSTITEVAAHNSLISMHNEGVRELAKILKADLTRTEDGDPDADDV